MSHNEPRGACGRFSRSSYLFVRQALLLFRIVGRRGARAGVRRVVVRVVESAVARVVQRLVRVMGCAVELRRGIAAGAGGARVMLGRHRGRVARRCLLVLHCVQVLIHAHRPTADERILMHVQLSRLARVHVRGLVRVLLVHGRHLDARLGRQHIARPMRVPTVD